MHHISRMNDVNNYSISTYADADYAEFSDLAHALYCHQFPHADVYPASHPEIENYIQNLLQISAGQGVILIIRVEQKLCGFVCLQGPADPEQVDAAGESRYVFLSDLFVHSQYRKQGLGTALLQAAEKWAVESGCEKIALRVMGNNKVAIRFYERHRFQSQFMVMNKSL